MAAKLAVSLLSLHCIFSLHCIAWGRKSAPVQCNATKTKPVQATAAVSHAASFTHAQASFSCEWSKYLIFAIVNGLHTFAIHCSHFLSPTRAIRSIFAQ